MKIINMKIKSQNTINWGGIGLLITIGLLMCATQVHANEEIEYKRHNTSFEMKTPQIDTVQFAEFEPPKRYPSLDITIKQIKDYYESVGSPIAHKVDWLVIESEKRGLEPKLIAAIQAKEGAWGRSYYCKIHYNCFGYGIMDSRSLNEFLNFESYEEGTSKILDYIAEHHPSGTAAGMRKSGYNFHKEWQDGVEEIQGYFN